MIKLKTIIAASALVVFAGTAAAYQLVGNDTEAKMQYKQASANSVIYNDDNSDQYKDKDKKDSKKDKDGYKY